MRPKPHGPLYGLEAETAKISTQRRRFGDSMCVWVENISIYPRMTHTKCESSCTTRAYEYSGTLVLKVQIIQPFGSQEQWRRWVRSYCQTRAIRNSRRARKEKEWKGLHPPAWQPLSRGDDRRRRKRRVALPVASNAPKKPQ